MGGLWVGETDVSCVEHGRSRSFVCQFSSFSLRQRNARSRLNSNFTTPQYPQPQSVRHENFLSHSVWLLSGQTSSSVSEIRTTTLMSNHIYDTHTHTHTDASHAFIMYTIWKVSGESGGRNISHRSCCVRCSE